MNCNLPCWSASNRPTAEASTRPAARSASICMNSITSNSATRVSATSTKTFARRSADTVMTASRPCRAYSCGIPVEAQPAGDDVGGHVGEAAVLREGVCPDARQRLDQADPELNHDHALRLEQFDPVV